MNNDIISLVYVVVHILTLRVIYMNLKGRAILYPGFYFAGLWLISTISEWLALKYDIASLPNELAIYELNMYAAYTSLVFMLYSFWGRKESNTMNTFQIAGPNLQYLILLMKIALFTTIIVWIIGGASFNFSENRADIVESQIHLYRTHTLFDSIMSICNTAMPFVTIVIGYYLGEYLAKKNARIDKRWFWVPLIIAIMTAMTQGGRISVLNALRSYVIGLGFSLPLFTIDKNRKLKIITIIGISAVLFLVFISVIGESRASYTGYEYNYSRFGIFAGVVDYMTSHYWGYQLRRLDYANDINLYYGINTFYGLLDFRLPFSSVIGINGNMWNMLGVDFDPLRIYKEGIEGSYTTSSQFMPLIADFGTKGCFIAVIFLVGLTHKLYLNVIRRPKVSAISLIFFYMAFCYWFGSNFNNGVTSLYTLIISALVYDIARKMSNKAKFFLRTK